MTQVNGGMLQLGNERRFPAKPETEVSGTDAKDKMVSRTQEATKIPNWVFPILGSVIGVLISTLVYLAYSGIRSDIQVLRDDMKTQQIWMQKTREQLIEHGWKADENGNMIAPQRGTNAESSR